MLGGFLRRSVVRDNVREIVFGLEDSLVSTLGAVTGMAAGTGDLKIVLLSGVVLIFVEALSMSAGSYLSTKSASEMERGSVEERGAEFLEKRVGALRMQEWLLKKGLAKRDIGVLVSSIFRSPRSIRSGALVAAFVMGVFYLVGGVFPLLPYLFFSVQEAILPSIVLTGAVLFFLGMGVGLMTKTSVFRNGLEMLVVSLCAALLGFFIGQGASALFDLSQAAVA